MPAVNEPVVIRQADGLSGDALNDEIMSDLTRLQELKHNFEVSVEEFQHWKPGQTKPAPKANKPNSSP